MKKSFLIFIFVFLINFSALGQNGVPGANSHIEKNFKASVYIQADDGHGSGVVIIKEGVPYIITAAHVVEAHKTKDGKFTPVTIKQKLYKDKIKPNGVWSMKADIVKFDRKMDIAILKGRVKKVLKDSVTFDFDYKTKLGEPIYHIGSPENFSLYNSLTFGYTTGIERKDDYNTDRGLDQSSCHWYGGSSGGGVFLKSSGKAIGICVQSYDDFQSIGLFLPLRHIKVWAKKHGYLFLFNDKLKTPSNSVLKKIKIETKESQNYINPFEEKSKEEKKLLIIEKKEEEKKPEIPKKKERVLVLV